MKIFKVLFLAIICMALSLFLFPFPGVAASVPCVITDDLTDTIPINESMPIMIVPAPDYGQTPLICNATGGHGESIQHSIETRPGHRHGTGVITPNDVLHTI